MVHDFTAVANNDSRLASIVENLFEQGFELPFHFTMIYGDGAIFGCRYTGLPDDHGVCEPEFLAVHKPEGSKGVVYPALFSVMDAKGRVSGTEIRLDTLKEIAH